jgi:hypothetical protein
MKSQNKKTVIIIIHFLYVLNLSAQNKVNQLFFDLPLQSARDTIYSSIKKYGFIEKRSNTTVKQNDQIIKTFNGYLPSRAPEKALTGADSTRIQLSLGSTSAEIDKYYQNILIVWSYYHFSNPRTAKLFYRDKKIEIDKITAEKQSDYNNSNNLVKTAVSDKSTDALDEKVSISFKREQLGYIVVGLEYQRNEGEKKLKRQFIPKKELVFREIDSKNVFRAPDIEQVPLTQKCTVKNESSITCFKESIVQHIWNEVDFYDFNLTAQRHQIALSFIITKNNEIINIKASHPNKKLCEEIMQSISEIKISAPAMKKGLKVNYLAEIKMDFSITY